jgi:ribosomal protein S8E
MFLSVSSQVRTQTLVKNAIVQVDAAPFKAWYQTHYGVELGHKGQEQGAIKVDELKASNHVKRKLKQRLQTRKLDLHLAEQFTTGRLLACIASRPGQSGRCDGYILEGEERHVGIWRPHGMVVVVAVSWCSWTWLTPTRKPPSPRYLEHDSAAIALSNVKRCPRQS